MGKDVASLQLNLRYLLNNIVQMLPVSIQEELDERNLVTRTGFVRKHLDDVIAKGGNCALNAMKSKPDAAQEV